MSCYYFNVFGSENIFDCVGTDLPSREEARERMIFIAMEIVEKFKVNTNDNWQMEALDERGAIVASMDFVVEIARHSPAKRD